MIPSTAVGVIFVLAALAPGHIYLRCYETRAARGPRAGVREVAEIAAIGAFFTVMGILISVGMGQITSWFYPIRGLLEGTPYLRAHPWAALASVALVLGISIGAGAVAGIVAGARRGGGELRTSLGTPWTDVLTAVKDPNHRPYAAIELQDGRVLEGFVLSVASDQPSADRDIGLRAPIMLTPVGKARRQLSSAYLLISGANVVAVSLVLVDISEAAKVKRDAHSSSASSGTT